MRGSCCRKSYFCKASVNGCSFGNVRYQYVTIPPRTNALKINLANLGSLSPITWYSDDITLKIQKKGCSDSCAEALVYNAETLDVSMSEVDFVFDEKFLALCRGRYEGIITIGCYELACRLDFSIGQNICVDSIEPTFDSDPDARTEPDPDCCNETEDTVSTQSCGEHSVCGDSIGCPVEEIDVSLSISQKELDAIDAWIAANGGSCAPNEELEVQCDPGLDECEQLDCSPIPLSVTRKGVIEKDGVA